MVRKLTYWGGSLLIVVLLLASGVGTAQAVNISFVSGDGEACVAGTGECVTVNPNTTIQAGHASTAPTTFILNGSGGAAALTHENVAWYHPTSNITEGGPGNGTPLNTFTGLVAHWVSYTDSGTQSDGTTSPNPPAVPNYCGTVGPGAAGTIGGNNNPTGTPGCTPASTDPKGNQNRTAPDSARTLGNQTATFKQTVTLDPTRTYKLDLYTWTDDTAIVEVLGLNGATLTGPGASTANPFPAPTSTAGACIGSPVSCPPGAGGYFTSTNFTGSSLLTLNMYAFQIGSDVFGALWGGKLTDVTPPSQVPEPATVLLIGSGLAGLGLLRRRKVS